MEEKQVFLDTAYAIALAAPTDDHHSAAVELAQDLVRAGTRLITTRAVILEIGNALSKQMYRAAGVELLDSLENDSNVEIVPLTEEICSKGFELYRMRQDKEWGMTDCISFVVMQERGLQTALTTDQHFEQTGFRALLRMTSS